MVSRLAASVLVLGLGFAGWAVAEVPGVRADAVTFGQSGCFSGSCRDTGLQYRGGILSAFHERNLTGGVNGRKLLLVSRDDEYDPDLAADNARWFVAANEVFAVIGGVGTPTAERMVPIFKRVMMPFVGHLTGADFLGNASRFPNVVNVRTGYAEETRQLVGVLRSDARRAARMIEVEVGEDHEVDLPRPESRGTDTVLEPRRTAVVADRVDVPEPCVLLATHTGIHEDECLRGLD